MRAVVFHGVEIPESLLAQEAQNHPSLGAAEARTAAGHALATKALLLHRAAQLGLTAAPELDDEGREETVEAALVRAVLEAEVEVTQPSEAECRRVYEAQRGRFRSQPLYEAAHILIEPTSASPPDEQIARAAALRLAQRLARDPGEFERLARDYSACPSGAAGGSLGQLQPGDLVAEVESALAGLGEGEIAAEPVRSRFGWHVLKLGRRVEARELPFEVAEPAIRLNLEARAWDGAASRYVFALAEAAAAQGVAITLSETGGVTDGSVCLGDFLGAGEAANRLGPWLEAADPVLFQRLQGAAGDAGVDIPAFVRNAAGEFVRSADDERWTQLISASQGAADPALAALASILKSSLAPAQQPRRNFTIISRRATAATA
jgi:peptidyl-prolyl cis-trans isomerase C